MKILASENIKSIEDKKIFFYGSCKFTKHAKEGAKLNNLKVDGVFDTTINKTNLGDQENFGVQVFPQESLKNLEKDTVFMVTCSHYNSVERHLNSFGFFNVYDSCLLIKNHLNESDLNDAERKAITRAHSALLEKRNHAKKQFNTFVIPSLDLILTEKCTLKCSDCANLMPYFSSPKDSVLEQMLMNLEIILDKVDKITELRILGGEPFIFRKINEILNFSVLQKKITHIVIYTNGTIVPRAETLEHLKNDKIILEITDYGKLSRNFERLINSCEEKKINYLIRKLPESWDDSGNIIRPSRSHEEDQMIFEECCAKYLYTLMHGKLYRCPFSASLDAIKKINLLPNNFQVIDQNTTKEKLQDFIYGLSYVDSCRYCKGRSKLFSRVKPARQSQKIREPFETISNLDTQ
jgi:organic radical activating enzyme